MSEQIKKIYLEYLQTENIYYKYRIKSVLENLYLSFPNNVFLQEVLLKIKKEFLSYDVKKHLEEKKKLRKKYVEDNQEIWKIIKPDVKIKKPMNYYFPNKDVVEMLRYLESFLKGVSEELYNFYSQLNDNKRIILDKKRDMNNTYLSNSDSIFIIINKLNNFEDIALFLNEIGYAYYLYVNKLSLNEIFNLNIDIKKKIPGKILELLFIKYLYHHNMYSSSVSLKNLFLTNLNSSIKIKDDYLKMQELLGYFVSYQYVNIQSNVSIEEMYQIINYNNLDNMLLYIKNSLSSQKKVIKKTRK